jgi:RimJ/RimL family protein N-acetyltransferase
MVSLEILNIDMNIEYIRDISEMEQNKDYIKINKRQQEQMLKLVTKSFYNELTNYGLNKNDIITASTHLLDHLIQKDGNLNNSNGFYNKDFTLDNIEDLWNSQKQLIIEDVSISPLKPAMLSQVALWMKNPAIKYSFISMFPDSESALKHYFERPTCDYFCIFYHNKPAGIIGADNIDNVSRKLEMKKFIGDTSLQGKGIGKRATGHFIYYCFIILRFNKVYIHSLDTNIRNINLNSKFGFELEGIFFEDVFLRNRNHEVLRMGLLRSRWIKIFSNT